MSEILHAGKYSAVPQVLVRKHARQMKLREWLHKELKEGGVLHRYIERERAMTATRYRRVAQRLDGWKQNNNSELRAVAHIPAKDFFRWNATDPDFWKDNSNLRSLRRDNPDVRVYL